MKNNLSRLLPVILCVVISSAVSYAQKNYPDSASTMSLPSIPFLPSPLVLDEGRKNIPVVTKAQWKQKQDWIREQYQYWVSGTVPPAPKTFKSKVLDERIEDGVKLRMVELTFGPEDKGKMTVELMIPVSNKKMPVFMTQWNHRGWAQIAVRRGYIGCVYAGADMKDDTRNYNDVFAGYDFATLMKRAWGGSRVIDYLYTLREVDTAKIGITGHSRNGKQSLMAAAFDTRIKAVISSCGGTGGESTFRWSDYRFTPGSFDRMVRTTDWFSPRINWFIGREQKLPVDQNLLMSLIAPRGLMLVSAITEDEGNPWGVEQSYQSVKQAYRFLHADSNIAIFLRPGRHQHAARDAEGFVDFFDYIFGRSKIAPENKLYYNYSFNKWKALSGENINPLKYPVAEKSFSSRFSERNLISEQDHVRQKIRWLLGEEPAAVVQTMPLSRRLKDNRSYPDDYLEEVIGEPALPNTVKKMTVGPYFPLAEDLWANIYLPATSVVGDSVTGKLPLIIYLHEYSYATGYHKKSMQAIRNFVEKGFAVLAFDLVGFGTRIEEAFHFYDRYPKWSLMGKMVSDTRNIINDAYTRMPFIDSTNIYLAGYSLGGTVALFTAALDNRVKGTAVVSAFSSLRNDNKGTEGIKRYSHLHGLMPRLGFFVGHEDRIPLDFDDVLGCIAPRSVFVMAPEQDREHNSPSVRQIVSTVSGLYGNLNMKNKLTIQQPNTYTNFTDSLQKQLAEWFAGNKLPL